MHELALARSLVAMAVEHAGSARLVSVTVRVGRLAAVVPDSLRFGFEVCATGTPAQGARLVVEEVPGRARCRTCAATVELSGPAGRCRCGSADLEWVAGQDLHLARIEVA